MNAFFSAILVIGAAGAALGQTAENAPRFEAADVHATASPIPFARGPYLSGERYDLRAATVVDLVARAYDLTPDKVAGGPNWLEFDRFDVSAKVPAKTTLNDTKLMLRTLLADRFGLTVRNEERPMPSFVLTAPKGKQKFKSAEGTGDTGCRMSVDEARMAASRPVDGGPAGLPPVPMLQYTCRNITMQAFADQMRTMAGAQQVLGTNPVRDKTALEGRWDFNFKYSLPVVAGGDTVSLADALEQLGLKLEKETSPQTVFVVESAKRPSPNEPEVAKRIPAAPTEFEVATIRPFVPGAGPNLMGVRAMPGGRYEMSGLSVKMLMTQAWSTQADSIVGAPKWMDEDRYTIVAQVPGGQQGQSPMDPDALSVMLRALLAERFQLKAHWEDRPMAAYTLTAPKPKLKKADPQSRTKFSEGNAGMMLLSGSGAPSRTMQVQNMSMAQLAGMLQQLAGGYIHSPVVDATGLEGGFDFSLSFSPIPPEQLATMMARAAQNNPAGAVATSADPIGGVSIFEAVDKQLGLKLVEQKRPVPVLVIDSVKQQPTEN